MLRVIFIAKDFFVSRSYFNVYVSELLEILGTLFLTVILEKNRIRTLYLFKKKNIKRLQRSVDSFFR